MIEWFTVVFGEPKEQAKLFTIVISTMLALIILLLNQWFINSRAKKERLITKLEELTTAVHGLELEAMFITTPIPGTGLPNQENILNLKTCAAEIDKLCSLYFNDLPIKTDIAEKVINRKIVEQYYLQTATTDREHNPHSIANTVIAIDSWSKETSKKIEILIQRHIK
ncbi:MAG: hypothetical protein JKY50_21300 [Oleispira sp.]|nr:hypothetical protein [Oleispira sp.]MBL4799943.1 hypothetical protein [Oleispira sp.]MBL4882096.1 hypothetical protein [Oleispira sp.]